MEPIQPAFDDVVAPGVPARVDPIGIPCLPMVVEFRVFELATSAALGMTVGAVEEARLVIGVFEDVGGGGMSVFRIRVPFFLGFGAACFQYTHAKLPHAAYHSGFPTDRTGAAA